jgi:hypothetical protein
VNFRFGGRAGEDGILFEGIDYNSHALRRKLSIDLGLLLGAFASADGDYRSRLEWAVVQDLWFLSCLPRRPAVAQFVSIRSEGFR